MEISELIAQADAKLNWMFYQFENELNIQILKFKNGPKYVDDILDKIIEETSTDKVIGYEEG